MVEQDVAAFLWHKFLESLAELESELSGSITISVFQSLKNRLSDFKAIEEFVNERDIMLEPYNYSKIIPLFNQLNDALAECRIMAHECRELNNKLSSFKPRRFSFVRNMKNRLNKIKKELEELQEQEDLHPLLQEIGNPLGKTGPKLSAQVFGFDEQSKKIEDLLVLNAGGFRAKIGVVGIAGVGKTTLVQKVLESEQVKMKFDRILWLPFSGMREGEQQYRRFSFETIIFDNLGSIICESIVGLENLLVKLGQLLLAKRYLIVLDDVCSKHINIMERLCRRLPKVNGGAVIVTTRLKEVAQKLGEQHSLVLVEPLDREFCWCIFEDTIKNRHADDSDFLLDEATKRIEEIKDQCHGLPLVAKTLADFFPESVLGL